MWLFDSKMSNGVCLFVCLFVSSISTHWRMFHLFGSVNITCTSEGLQVLTYARHSWPLSREESLVCHTYCNREHLFIMVIFEDPWQLHLLLSVWLRSCHYLFLLLRFVAAGIRTPKLPLAGPTLSLNGIWKYGISIIYS